MKCSTVRTVKLYVVLWVRGTSTRHITYEYITLLDYSDGRSRGEDAPFLNRDSPASDIRAEQQQDDLGAKKSSISSPVAITP